MEEKKIKQKQTTFEEEVEKEFRQNGFKFKRVNSGYFLPIPRGELMLYPRGEIIYEDKEMLFCSPNVPTGVRVNDARLFANRDLVELLMINGVSTYFPGNVSQLTYGIMASSSGSVINPDSLQFSLSPHDARDFSDELHSFAYIIMKGSYHKFAKMSDQLEKEIYLAHTSGGVVEGKEDPLVVSMGAIGSVDVLGTGEIRILRGNQRKSDQSYPANVKKLLETEVGKYVISDGETFFSAHEWPKYPFQEKNSDRFAVDVFSNERLAEKALERWTPSIWMEDHRDYRVVKIDQELIKSF